MHDEARNQPTSEERRRAGYTHQLVDMLRRLIGNRGTALLVMDRDGHVRAVHKYCADDGLSTLDEGS